MSYQKIPPESYPPPGYQTPYQPPSAPPEGSFDRFPPPQAESYQSYFHGGGYPTQPPQFPPGPSPYPPQQYPYPPPYAPQQYPPPEHCGHHRDDDGCLSFLKGW